MQSQSSQSSRIPAASSAPNMSVNTSSPRLTPANPRVPFAEVLKGAATAGAELAVRTLPGGPAIAVAVRGGSLPGGAMGFSGMTYGGVARAGAPAMSSAMGSAEGPSGTGAAAAGAVGVNAAAGAAGVNGGNGGAGSEAASFDQAMAHSQDMNLYFLRVQEEVNAQNRTFTTLSNVMKAEHETVKTAIGNIR